MTPRSANGRVQFGIFEFDPQLFELRRNGAKVKLQDQPGQILSALLAVPGELVTREELRSRLWSEDTFVDFDHSLNAAIKRLRDALGDSADNPIFVETLARRGYRFLAPVVQLNGDLAASSTAVSPASLDTADSAGKWSLRVLWWGLAGLLLTTGAVSAAWHATRSAARLAQPREVRLTANSSDAPVEGGAISPGARLLLYSDKVGLHVKDTTNGEIHPITMPPEFKVTWASWYPDESHILVSAAASAKERTSLWKLSLWGGAPQKLMDDAELARVSPDGKKVIFLRGEYLRREIWSMNSDGSEVRKEVEAKGHIYGAPVWSPDSLALAYVRVIYFPNWNDEDEQIETHLLGSAKSEIVLKDHQLSGGLAWLADGRMVFTLIEPPPSQGDSNLWALPIDAATGRATGERVRITNEPDHKPVVDASADGKKVLFLRMNIQPAVYVAEIDRKTKTVGWPQRLTLDDRKTLPFEWTPDGKAVLYTSNDQGRFHIYKQTAGTGTPELLDTGGHVPNILRLSPDRTKVLYVTAKIDNGGAQAWEHDAMRDRTEFRGKTEANTGQATDMFQIMRMPLEGGESQTVLEWPAISNFQCARLPSRVCIFSSYANEALEFYDFDAETGKSSLMFRISDPQWALYNWSLSPDGQQLALAKKLRAQEEAEIQVMSLRGGSTRKITLKEWRSVHSIDWASDGKSIWACASPREGEEMIVSVDLQGHVKPAVKELGIHLGWAIPSQDGKRLAITEERGASNVWMLEKF